MSEDPAKPATVSVEVQRLPHATGLPLPRFVDK